MGRRWLAMRCYRLGRWLEALDPGFYREVRRDSITLWRTVAPGQWIHQEAP